MIKTYNTHIASAQPDLFLFGTNPSVMFAPPPPHTA
jgi:hypothetical protein